MVWPDGSHRPQNRAPNDRNIESSKREVAQTELNWREGNVGKQIDRERNRDRPWDLLTENAIENVAERDQDDRVEDLPNQSDRRWLGGPSRFIEGVVPVSPGHEWKLDKEMDNVRTQTTYRSNRMTTPSVRRVLPGAMRGMNHLLRQCTV